MAFCPDYKLCQRKKFLPYQCPERFLDKLTSSFKSGEKVRNTLLSLSFNEIVYILDKGNCFNLPEGRLR